MQLKLGFFSDANVLKNGPEVNPKVWVRLKLGVYGISCPLMRDIFQRFALWVLLNKGVGVRVCVCGGGGGLKPKDPPPPLPLLWPISSASASHFYTIATMAYSW